MSPAARVAAGDGVVERTGIEDQVLPQARRATIELPGHVPDPALLGPVLSDFYTG